VVLSAGLGTASMTTGGHGVQVLAATKPAGLQGAERLASCSKDREPARLYSVTGE